MCELWKDVYGYEGLYEVSNQGRVRSLPMMVNVNYRPFLKDGKILNPQPRRHGYLAVWLYKNGSRKQVSVHRLVAEAFCEKKAGCDEVNHLNENKQDNRAENLEWSDRSSNCSYGNELAEKRKLWRNNKRSTPVRQLTMSGELVAEYPSLHEARRQTGFNESNIHNAISKKYSHAYGFRWEYA